MTYIIHSIPIRLRNKLPFYSNLKSYKFFTTLILTAIFFITPSVSPATTIRVLINVIKTNQPKTLSLQCREKITLTDCDADKIISKSCEISLPSTKIICTHLQAATENNTPITFKDQHYAGSLHIHFDKKNSCYLVVNHLDLDDYLYAILPNELYQSWPIEMHKIQAVASRSYVLACARDARKKKQLYDVRSSNHSQVYRGTHEHKHLWAAIDQTRGMVLTHEGKPILAMFDACCGGICPALIERPEIADKPYLNRMRTCHFCANYNLYSWQKTFKFSAIEKALNHFAPTQKFIADIGKLQSICAEHIDQAGVVHTIKLTGSKGTRSMPEKDFFEIVRHKIKSHTYTVQRNGAELNFSGSGFGHHLGLCQRGARELVKRGWKTKSILAFYYPHTKMARMDTNAK